jgi:iron complex outermembrane receptor protein
MKNTILLLLFICLSSIAIGQITFNGQVKNAETNAPVGSAFIRISNGQNVYNTYATPNGSFTISKVVKGVYTINISHIGFQVLTQEIEITSPGSEFFFLQPDMSFLDAAIISTVRAKNTTPSTFSNLSKKEIQSLDQSKDFPFLLNTTPSTVISSDAGNGIGYTGIRIRGIDPTRVNVTINGIPINDAESQGLFWVNMPDLASSTESVQIQRGVGTSTNGAAAFGASVNIRTNELPEDEQTQVSFGVGSFNTQRASLLYSTGRLKNDFSFQFRGSLIQSDGFIDRASSDLKSANIIAAKYWEKSVLKANVLLGSERTYQAWWGIPQPTFEQNFAEEQRYINQLGISGGDLENLQNSNSKTYNYYTYENEVDNYNQNHYQLFYDYNVSQALTINSAAYITTGAGYFEQFRNDDELADYGLPNEIRGNDTFTSADVVRRRWLDNILVGGLASANWRKNKWDITLGGGYNSYQNRHFGEAIATEFTGYEDLNALYYDNDATKTDGNVYTKISYNFKNFFPYIDLQYRLIDYQFEGFDNNLEFTPQQVDFAFFNPKFGLTYLLKRNTFYAMYAIGNREPVRDDFRDSRPDNWPLHEQLNNIEAGYRYAKERTRFGLNFYNMNYTNQLVLTGAVNDVGEAIRVNVPESYRRGVELDFQLPIAKKWQFGGNATLSQNKITSFTEELPGWTEPYTPQITLYEDTDISFSPNQIYTGILGYQPNENFQLNLMAKHVGQQYLDNTQSEDRKLDAFTNVDASFTYTNKTLKGLKQLQVSLFLNNVLNEYYAPNGYTFSGMINGVRSDFNYLYPMAGFNWMLKLAVVL